MNSISHSLLKFRRKKLANDIESVIWTGFSAVLVVLLLLGGLEALFWFPTFVRYGAWTGGAILIGILILAVGSGALMVRFHKISRYSLATIAKEVGERGLSKPDEALNALQLELASVDVYGSSQQLVKRFVQQVASRLEVVNPADVFANREVKRSRTAAATTTVLFLLLSALFYSPLGLAADRWMHPRTHFPAPHPFELESATGNLSIMGGDDATIKFTASGKIPDVIQLEMTNPEKRSVAPLTMNENREYTHTVNDVFQNLEYRAFVTSRHFWEPWNEISSPAYSIHVTDRPKIEDFRLTLTPPEYTGMNEVSQKGNVAEIRGLTGSILDVELTSDRPLSRAYLKYAPKEETETRIDIPMTVDRKRARGGFTLETDGIFETYLFDERDIPNLDPIAYHIMVIEDMPPELEVLEPVSPMELGSDFTIPIRLHIEDDFGFSNLQIVHETHHPHYLSPPSASTSREEERPTGESTDIVNIHRIGAFSRKETSQDVFYIWDVNEFNLMPEDELHFHFELYDNDEVSGPKKSISSTLVARFPSLADLFARTVEEEQTVEEEAEDIVEDLREIDEALKAVELEVLKSEKLSWEQEQTVKQSVEELRKKLEQIRSLQEKLQEIVEQSEKHNLFSTELIEKFRNLQELLENIMTPELQEAMEKMREAMATMQPGQLLNALQDFQVNRQELEEQLDRFLDIFRRIRAEQNIDELLTRMENLVRQQEAVVDRLKKVESDGNLPRIADEQERNRREFETVRDFMRDASESMEPFAPLVAQELGNLSQSDLSQRTWRNLESATSLLNRRNATKGLESATSAHADLQEMLTELETIRNAFRQQTVGEMVMKFERVLSNTLFLSKEQEHLQVDTKDVPRNSPRLGEMATRQQLLRDQLGQLIQSLVELSHQTFAVSPQMGKAIGRATAGMNESLKKLEERNGQSAAENQEKTVAALNEAALATLAAIDQMKESGMSSGLEQFLKRMQQMASQQQGINQQTLQLALGQMAAIEQERLMRRLTQDQQRLKKSLDQLRREMRGVRHGSGSLDGISDEMEEVVKDFGNKDVTRRTVERQRRILTRMLDSQKSLKRQDFTERRLATAGQDIVREGPSGLPGDLGQRRSLAMEALNLALKAGYSRDYQDMIRRYFNALIESPDLIQQHDDEKP